MAVSISSGVAAITSAVPSLTRATVPLGLAAIAILLAGNLRRIRQAGTIFSAPTYAFLLGMFALIAVGLIDASTRDFAPTPVVVLEPIEGIGAILVLRALASGATAMTGIEAISNAVPAFQPPAARNARTVLMLMVGLLVTMFAGLVVLMHLDGIVPRSDQTALSQLAHHSFGSGPLYAYVQVATALVLLLAANTAFNGFPRLLSFMARNGHAPRLFLRLGDRLAFSNGTVALAIAAAVLFVAFNGRTGALIPVYAVGVFLAFTLSQTGMVVHWCRRRDEHWRQSMLLNALGAALSAIVFVIATLTKFQQGAWVALLLVALLVLVTWHIRRHYDSVHDALAVRPLDSAAPRHPIAPAHVGVQVTGTVHALQRAEDDESPDQLQHLAVVPIVRLDRSSLRALAYAASLGQPVLAVHISPGEHEAEGFKGYWRAWGDHVPLEVVASPYRAVVAPLACYIDALSTQRVELTVTVVVPELIVKHRYDQALHNGTARRLRRALRHQPGVVITTVPVTSADLTAAAGLRRRLLACSWPLLRQATPQDLLEDDGVVVLCVMGGIDERERAFPRPASERRELGTLTAELLDVAPTELLKASRVMPEPLPELRARGQFLLPAIEPGLFARDATRPQPVDQHAIAVRWKCGLIRALQADIHM